MCKAHHLELKQLHMYSFCVSSPALNQSLFALSDDCRMLSFFLALIWSDGPSFSA